jgi:hypothetical protein
VSAAGGGSLTQGIPSPHFKDPLPVADATDLSLLPVEPASIDWPTEAPTPGEPEALAAGSRRFASVCEIGSVPSRMNRTSVRTGG